MLTSLVRSAGARTTAPLLRSAVLGATSVPAIRRFADAPAPKKDPYAALTETVRDFLNPAEFFDLLRKKGIDFYTGVPDSLLKDFCSYVSDNALPNHHIITANEGAAVGVAAGYYMATQKFPVVYMQNSGFGNAVNPLLSLCDPKVYSIPSLLMIGWRGEPGKKDEPQHLVQGKCMSSMLADMNIAFEVLPDYIEGATEALDTAVHYMETRLAPYALLVKRQCFSKYALQSVEPNLFKLNREEAMKIVISATDKWDVVVATTGFASREVYEYREELRQNHSRDFLCVGSMGHASAIALGIAAGKRSRQVFVLDGDGAALMHMGNFATIGTVKPENLKHIVLNNGAHDSVGGQPTRAFDIDLPAIARSCGYTAAWSAVTAEEIAEGMAKLRSVNGPALMEIRINKGVRADLGRPRSSPKENKAEFMRFLAG